MDMFNPSRLAIARKRRKLSKKELASKAGLSPVTITRLEKGYNEPDPETLEVFSSILEFPKGFFFGRDIDEIDESAISFRSLKSLTAKERDAAVSSTALTFLMCDWVDEHFNIPDTDIIPLDHSTDAESAAIELRRYWGLGEKPISNMVKLVESKGVRVFSLSEDTRNVNAFCFWRNETPYIFLNTFKSAESSRFDVAHELGHLVLHKKHSKHKGREAENEADAFAASFLMPRPDVISSIRSVKSIDQLILYKARWKVSVAALNYRLHKIGLLSDWEFRRFCIQIAKNGYRTNEPASIERERSIVWEKIFQELWKDKTTKTELAKRLDIPPDQIENLVSGLSKSRALDTLQNKKLDRLKVV